MTTLKSNFRRVMLAAILLALMLPSIQGAGREHRDLYLLSGFATPKLGGWGFPSSLYRVDLRGETLVLVRDIVDRKTGTDHIQADNDRRIIVLGAPYLTPEHFEWIDMNAPAVAHSYEIPTQGYSLIHAGFLEIPERGLYHVLELAQRDKEGLRSHLVGMRLFRDMPPAEKAVELSWKYYKYVRSAGRPRLVAGTHSGFSVRIDNGALHPLKKVAADQTLGDVRLTGNAGLSNGEKLTVPINTDDFLVLSRRSDESPDLNGFGFTLKRIYLKKSKRWQTWELPGANSWVRAFSPWLTSTAAERGHGKESPGNQERRVAILHTDPRFLPYSVDTLFRDSGYYLPGILTVYHPETGRTFTIRTEQGDSEVILVADDTVYYRVNQSLYAAKIGRTELGSPKLLVRDPRVSFVHWAFLGPKTAE